ncbi:hypothetical protein BVX93_00060 [bacterium B13(2017)]|nr:hypothetical protein BVX93_00060 [bacterium B13(2017)]
MKLNKYFSIIVRNILLLLVCLNLFGLAPSSKFVYQFIPIQNKSLDGEPYIIGHAMLWDSRELSLGLIISEEAMHRDYVSTAMAPAYAKEGVQISPLPGYNIREASQIYEEAIALFNLGESGMLIYPVLVNGQLITKPRNKRVVLQQIWEPLTGIFPFFIQKTNGEVEIKDIEIENNSVTPEFQDIMNEGVLGFSAPYIMKNGNHTPLKNFKPYPLGQPPRTSPKAGEIIFPGGNTKSPISALGITYDGIIIRISLVGDLYDIDNIEKLPTEFDLVRFLQEFNVKDALYTGASAEVQYYDKGTNYLNPGIERPKSPDRMWERNPGRSERGMVVNGILANDLKIYWTHLINTSN